MLAKMRSKNAVSSWCLRWAILSFSLMITVASMVMAGEKTEASEVRVSATCDQGQIFFLCRLSDGNQVEACGMPLFGTDDDLQLQVRLTRDGDVLWRWPEEGASAASFFFEQQTHVRSVSYHLWFERHGEVIDVVDHWTEGSHDSHFAGLIVQGGADGQRQTLPCEDLNPVVNIKALEKRLPHRAVPVP